jgi:O-antigen/teichoic acid export membrane protein
VRRAAAEGPALSTAASSPGTSTHGEIARFFRHSGVYAFGNALNRAGAFLLLPAYTKYLSVGEYGSLELFSTVSAVITGLLSMGLAHATLRFYFEYEDERQRQSVVSTNLIAAFALGVLGSLLIAPAEGPLMAYLFPGASYRYGLWIVLATLVLELSSQICLAYLRALERSVFFVVLTVAKLLLQLVANTVLLVVYDAGVEGVLFGNFLAVALGFVVVGGFTLRHCGLRFEMDKLTPVLRYSFPFLLATLVAIVSSNVDRLFVNGLLSLEALGLYSLAVKFSRLTSDLIGEPFGRAYGAFRFTVMGRPDAAAIQARIVRYLAAFLAVVGLAIVYLGRDVLLLMADPKFLPAAALLPPLVLAGVLQVVTYPLQTGFLYHKATRHIFHISVVQALLTTGGSYLLIKYGGLRGASLSPLLVAVVVMVLTHRLSGRYFPVRYEYRRLAWLVGLTGVFFACGLPLAGLALGASLAVKTALLAAFVGVLLASPVFEREELSKGRDFLRKRFRP